MEAIAGSFFNKIGGCVWDIIALPCSHFCSLGQNIKTLRKQMEYLSAQEKEVKDKLKVRKANNMVKLWLERVRTITIKENDIQNEFVEDKKCLKGFLPNYYMRMKLSKRVVEANEEVDNLRKECEEREYLFANPKPDIGLKRSRTTLVGKTTEETLETVWKCLMDPDIQMIGVYGMGGAGKTTIINHINDELMESDVFEKVIHVTVSNAFNLEKLKNQIATYLDLDVSKIEDEKRKADMLLGKLQSLKFVIILDDLWEELSLEMIGIPPLTRKNGCKLILTTRFFDLCRRMKCQEAIKVQLLSEEEAWELFKQNVGNKMKFNPEVEKIAKDVARECACLPLAIVTIGNAMSPMDEIVDWRVALRELQRLNDKTMEEKVIGQLLFSYERLPDKVRECFLYCALYSEGHKIPSKELIEYWIADGLIDDCEDREEQMDSGHVVLRELKRSCMLENVNGGYLVKMHDLIRDMAIHITRKSNRFIVKVGVGSDESFEVSESWEDVEWVSLVNNHIKNLVDEPKCSKLSTIFLQNNSLLKKIPHSFFQQMPKLRVLDLSNTDIMYLPESLSRLVELRLLNLNHTRNLQLFPAGLLPNLLLLENLSMRDCGWKWSLRALMKAKSGACIEEIISLPRLCSLKIDFEDLQSWTSCSGFEKWKLLKSFNFAIGHLKENVSSKQNFSVEIVGCNLSLQESSLMFPDNTQFSYIENCITQLSELSRLNDLKGLYIIECEKIEKCFDVKEENILSTLETLHLIKLKSLTIVCKGVEPTGISLPSLKELHLAELRHLERICMGVLICNSLERIKVESCQGLMKLHICAPQLKYLDTSRCDSLKNLSPLGLSDNLQNLEEISVCDCKKIEVIVTARGEEEVCEASNRTIQLPNLKKLRLEQLPELKRICERELVCDSLYSLAVSNCPLLKKLPFSVDNIPPNLKEIEGQKEWWDALEWDDPSPKLLLQRFFKDLPSVVVETKERTRMIIRKKKMLEEIKVALYVQQAALHFIGEQPRLRE